MQKLVFANGACAIAAFVETDQHLNSAFSQFGLDTPRPVIVVVGGASKLQEHHANSLRSLFVKVLAPVAETWNAVVVDGGTDAGVMRMMGSARAKIHASFPLVGVLPIGVAALPGSVPPSLDAAPLESHHTHFFLVPGNQWGDESAWIADIASRIAKGLPTVTVLINGGDITWKDATKSVEAGRPIVAVAGSGRAADVLVDALAGKVTDKRADRILASGLLQAVSLENDAALADAVQRILSGRQPINHSSTSAVL